MNLLVTNVFQSSKNESLIIELLYLFHEILNPSFTTCNLFLMSADDKAAGYYLKTLQFLNKYFKYIFSESKRESESLIVIFKVINRCLINLSSTNVNICYNFYEIGIQFLLDIKAIKSRRLINELSLFANIIPSYILLIDQKEPNEIGSAKVTPEVNQSALISNRSSKSEISDVFSAIVDASSEVDDSMHLSDEDEDLSSFQKTIVVNKKRTREYSTITKLHPLNDLSKVIEILINLLFDNSLEKNLSLPYKSVNLHLTPTTDKNELNLFHMKYISLSKDQSSTPWLLRLGISQLVIHFYELKSKLDQSYPESVSIFKNKRQHLSSVQFGASFPLSEILQYYSNPIDALISILFDGAHFELVSDVTICQIALLTFGSISSTTELKCSQNLIKYLLTNINDILSKLMTIFEKQDITLKYWVLFLINVIYSISFNYSKHFREINNKKIPCFHNSPSFNKLLKYNLELLKDPIMCEPSCIFLSHISMYHFTSNEEAIILDKAILQQYENVIDLSEINGPANISKESVMFWITTLKQYKSFKFKNIKFHAASNGFDDQLYSSKVSNWFHSKFSQLPLISNYSDIMMICLLLSWLAGIDDLERSSINSMFTQYVYKGELLKTSIELKEVSTLSSYVLKSTSVNNLKAIDDNMKIIELDILSYNEHKRTQIRLLFCKFLESLSENVHNVKWAIASCLLLDSDELQLSHSIDLLLELIKEKFNNFISNNSFNEYLAEYFDIIDHIPADNFTWLTKISQIVYINKVMEITLHVLNTEEIHSRLEREDDFFDSFIPTTRQQSFNSFPDYFKYNRFNLYYERSTLEQKATHYILKQAFATMDIQLSFETAIKFISKIRSKEKFLAGQYEVLKMIECTNSSLNEDVVDLLFTDITTLLENHMTKTYECSLFLILKLFRILAKVWISSKKGIESDGKAVYDFVMNLNEKHMLHSEKSLLEFFKLCIQLLIQVDDKCATFDKTKILANLESWFSLMNNFFKFQTFESITDLVKNNEEKLDIYSKFVKSFHRPQFSTESSATFCLFMTKISLSSETLIIATISNLLELSQYENIFSFLQYAINQITRLNNIESAYHLFWNYKEIFLKCWESFEFPIEKFPFMLFDFKHLEDFILKMYKEITALSLAYNHVEVIDTISKITDMKRNSIVSDSIPLSITLAWTNGGVKNKLFKTLENFFSSAKTLKMTLREQFILIAFQLFRFCDCSSESEIIKSLSSQGLNITELNLFSADAKVLSFLNEYEIQIDPKSCISLLLHFANMCKVEEIWTVQLIYHLTSRLLLLISSSILVVEKIICLRKLKLLLTIAQNGMKNTHICEVLTNSLAPLLKSQSIKDEVSLIMRVMLERNKNIHSVISIPIWASLLGALFGDDKSTNIVELKKLVIELKSKVKLGAYDECFKYGIEIIENADGFPLPDFVSFVNNAFDDTPNTHVLIEYISSLFNYSSAVKSHRFKIDRNKLSSKFIDNIYSVKLEYSKILSKSFSIWIGKCFGVYYENTGNYPKTPTFEFENTLLRESIPLNFNEEVKSMDIIFKLLLAELPNAPLKNTYCVDSIIGVILNKFNIQAESVSSFISYDRLFASFEEFIFPMGNYVCSLSIDQVEDNTVTYYRGTLETALNGFSTKICTCKIETWITEIMFSIISELSSQSSIIVLLANYICHSPSFAIKCFCPLVLYYIETQTTRRGTFIVFMIDRFFKENMKKVPKKAIEIFVELALLIRLGAKAGNVKFISIYKQFYIDQICEAALLINRNKSALMLYEDYYTTIDIINVKNLLHEPAYYNYLKATYSGIENSDLMFGLPIVPEMSYGLEILKHKNIKSGEMMFNNAIFDSRLLLNNNNGYDAITDIADGMMTMGWSGISNILTEYSQNEDTVNEASSNSDLLYEQMWKLNQWDIPVVDNGLTENKCIYSVLRQVKERPQDSKDICHDAIEKLVSFDINTFGKGYFSKIDTMKSWLRTLSICNTVEEITSLENLTFEEFMKKCNQSNIWFRNATVSDFENILLSRRSVFELITKCGNSNQIKYFDLSDTKCYIGIINELHIYNKIMTDNGVTQKAINSSVLLNQISQNRYNNKNIHVHKIAKFNLANAFWTQQSDTRFPIETLKNIIEMENTQTMSDERTSETNEGFTRISKELIISTIAKWCDECKQETSSMIMSNYILPNEESLENISKVDISEDLGLTYHIMAKFCDDQISRYAKDTSIDKVSSNIKMIEKDIRSIKKFIKEEADKEKKRYALQDLNRLQIRHKVHIKELQASKLESNNYIEKAVHFYFKSIEFGNHEFCENDIDRFCSLWIEHNDINIGEDELLGLPMFNFVPWCNQLVSKLLDEETNFQVLLRKLVINISLSHPFHILYLLKSLIMTKKESDDSAAVSRGKVSEKIWVQLKVLEHNFNVENISGILESVNSFADNAVVVAASKLKNTKKISISKVPNGKWWLDSLPLLNLPSPVKSILVKKIGSYKESELPIIRNINEQITIAASGVSHPKIMKLLLSNGENQKMLLKAPDDLRQDSIMKQVFEKVNKILWKDIETRKRNLRIRVYNVLPLGPTSGVLEFVPNSVPLIDILKSMHVNDELDINEARLKMKEVQTQSKAVRYQVYKDICKKVLPNLRGFFYNNFTSPDLWFDSRVLYSNGIATTSITGYVLGIGDRHCNNILLDKSSGEPIHIDFGVAFDQGKTLPIPETVPFRLTRDLVDGMGITGVNGIFSKSCEHVLRVLRLNKLYISGILNVLKYDPLYSWTLSPLRKKKLKLIYFTEGEMGDVTGNNNVANTNKKNSNELTHDIEIEANTAIETVKNKLEAKGLSDEAVVRELIRDATDENNLSVIFMGWAPFL